ncbi:putative cysteine-rich receptor-like protein kinase 9 [Cryptomeria japonica]|uniref:putative cysteine-rich receptor-like protein kinase 9 n=1 Tax=Cryptomeria japonica TaxID=3369 RepID=UPI0025ACDF44|nr:putative cysteine-rich receptor-like protein kinase 9 [Cryptomeria japonica]
MDEEEIVQADEVYLVKKKDDTIIHVVDEVKDSVDLSGDNTTLDMEPPEITDIQVTLVEQPTTQLKVVNPPEIEQSEKPQSPSVIEDNKESTKKFVTQSSKKEMEKNTKKAIIKNMYAQLLPLCVASTSNAWHGSGHGRLLSTKYEWNGIASHASLCSNWVAEHGADLSYKMMCSSYFSILLFFFVMNFSSVISDYRWHECNNGSTYSEFSAYSANVNRVMTDLFKNSHQSSGFNTSSFGQTPNKVYGLLQCFGNLSAEKCSDCAQQANSSLMEHCANDIGGLVFMDDCFLRYDNSSFISTLDTNLYKILWNPSEVSSNIDDFKATTSSLLSNLSNLAYNPANSRFAIGSANYTTSQIVYGLVQCWRDLSINDCRKCLVKARNTVEDCCSVNQGGRALLGSCVVRFESYSFFDTTEVSSPQASPPTPTTSAPPTAGQNQSKSKHNHLF